MRMVWKMHQFYDILRFIFMISVTFMISHGCPDECKCTGIKSALPSNLNVGHKVVCSSLNSIVTFTDSSIPALPNDTIHLVLRGNFLSSIPPFSFAKLSSLKKLDLSNNNLSEIQENAFSNLTLLEKLDLSHNKISKLVPTVFNPLDSLLRLNLQANFITQLADGLFHPLKSVKVIDLRGNPLNCDCHLKWFVEWVRSRKIALPAKTNCKVPRVLEGVHLLRVPKKEFHCQRPLELPLFELDPSVSQLVFEGDSFALHCRVSNVGQDIEMFWMLNNERLHVTHNKLMINITSSSSPDGGQLLSSLYIDKIQLSFSGDWKCLANSSKGSEFRNVQVIVIASKGKFCPRISSDDSKGHYIWAETPAGITIESECAGKRTSSGLSYQNARAYHTCSSEGLWENLNTSLCPFTSEVTNVLEQFSKANFSFAHANILDSARLLQNYTSGNSLLNDKMDVVFISRTLQNYIRGVPHNHEIAEVIVDIINTLMSLDKKLLKSAELEDQACTRLLEILEQLSELLTDVPLNHVAENIAVEDFFIKSEGFPGITCFSSMKNNNVYNSISIWSPNMNNYDEKVLKCNIANPTISSDELNDAVEASLHLPSTIFQQTGMNALSVSTHKLQFIIYRNSMLFSRSLVDSQLNEITSLIISGKIAHVNINNLSEPVIVSLRTSAYTSDIKPVWWNTEAFGGRGDWSGDGCSILKVHGNVVTFSCNRLSSFGLLQDVKALVRQYAFEKAQFRFGHPAVYVGSVLCVLPLIVTIAVYCYAYKRLKMSNKMKHSLINTFLSLILLCITFAFGVNQTDIVPVCQGIGFMLHYFTLCSLFWMLVSASNLYKKLVKSDQPTATSTENLSDHPLPPKPMLRFYLVGWGISSIICGISAAVDVDNYGGIKFCFLSLNPSLGALCAPALFLLFLLSFLYLLVYCAIHRRESVECVNDGIFVELHDTTAVISCEVQNEGKNSDCEEEENIQSYELQLQGHATLLLLFLLTWLSAYSTIGRPVSNHLPYDELVFALLFCFFSSVLGIYCFILFCYCRTDIRQYFPSLCKKAVPTNKTPETLPMIVNQSTCILSTTSPDVAANVFKEVTVSACDSTSLHHSSIHAYSSDHSANNLKLFYDPRQSELARRFFEKSRRQQQVQQSQKNNLERTSKSKSEAQANVKYSKGSNSSQIIIDYRSESLNEDRSSGSQNSSAFLRKSKYPQTKRETRNNMRLKCRYLGENVCPNFSSDNSQLPTSALCHSCCSDMSSDVFSKPVKRQKHWEMNQCKCCDNHPRACYRTKRCAHGASFSAEDLKCHSHCLCRSYSPCHKMSNDECNLRSNSEMSVASCKYLNEE